MYKFRDYYIPDRMMAAIERYTTGRVKPGAFLCAVICNNLREACAQADDENLANLPAFIGYFYNEAPSQCWGSAEKMAAWLDFQPTPQDGSILGLMQSIKTSADKIIASGQVVIDNAKERAS